MSLGGNLIDTLRCDQAQSNIQKVTRPNSKILAWPANGLKVFPDLGLKSSLLKQRRPKVLRRPMQGFSPGERLGALMSWDGSGLLSGQSRSGYFQACCELGEDLCVAQCTLLQCVSRMQPGQVCLYRGGELRHRAGALLQESRSWVAAARPWASGWPGAERFLG